MTTRPAEPLSLQALLALARDERRTLGLTLAVTLALAFLYLVFAVPTYRATGLFQVSQAEEVGVKTLLNLAHGGQPNSVGTDIELLRSRRIMGAAVQRHRLVLTQPSWPLTSDLSVSLLGASPLSAELQALRAAVRDLQVDQSYRKEVPATLVVTEGGALALTLRGDPAPVQVAIGGTLSHRGISFVLERPVQLEPGTRVEVEFVPNHVLVDDLLEDLGVRNLGPRQNETSVVEVTFRAADRTVARDVVNAVMDAYAEYALELQTLEANRAAQFIEEQLAVTRRQLDETARELQAFQEESGGMLLTEQGRELVQAGARLDVDRRALQAEEELLAAAALEIGRHAREGGALALADKAASSDPEVSAALADYAQRAASGAPGLAAARGPVQGLLERARVRVGQRRLLLERSLAQAQTQLGALPEKQRELTAIQRKLAVSEHLFTVLMTKLEEARILRASKTTDKRVIDPATVPYTKVAPKRILLGLAAVLLGLLAGIALVLGRQVLDPRVRDQEEALSLTGLPLHGTVGALGPALARGPVGAALEHALQEPRGAFAEAFRALRISLEFAAADGAALKAVLVTSAQASEGKSTVVANLAAALARAGHRVLVVDADLRRARQHEVWGLPRCPGLSDLLVGHEAAPQPTRVPGVSLLSAGQEPPEPQTLLGSQAFADRLAQWRTAYDLVLFDAPPLLLADSLLVARRCDLTLFVVRPRTSVRTLVLDALRSLTQAGLRAGLVVNGVPTVESSYNHYFQAATGASRATAPAPAAPAPSVGPQQPPAAKA